MALYDFPLLTAFHPVIEMALPVLKVSSNLSRASDGRAPSVVDETLACTYGPVDSGFIVGNWIGGGQEEAWGQPENGEDQVQGDHGELVFGGTFRRELGYGGERLRDDGGGWRKT